jgi:succinoglycan biosynthesis protein ExoA
VARRQTLLELGGFNELLYPNEENALMDEIQKRGGRLLYDPGLSVLRRPRGTIKAFVKMLLTYGRGRAEQFRVHPTAGSSLNFVPPLFCVFLVALPFLGKAGLVALGVYLLAVLMQVLAVLARGGFLRSLVAAPFIVLTHILYGLGFWRGLFTKLNRDGTKPPVEVVLETITI